MLISFCQCIFHLLFCLISAAKTSNNDLAGSGGTNKATGDKLKCEPFPHTLADGYVVCNGEVNGSTCWTVCIEGYEKEKALIGSFECQENGEWSGEGTTCAKKDCGPLNQVFKNFQMLKLV